MYEYWIRLILKIEWLQFLIICPLLLSCSLFLKKKNNKVRLFLNENKAHDFFYYFTTATLKTLRLWKDKKENLNCAFNKELKLRSAFNLLEPRKIKDKYTKKRRFDVYLFKL